MDKIGRSLAFLLGAWQPGIMTRIMNHDRQPLWLKIRIWNRSCHVYDVIMCQGSPADPHITIISRRFASE